MPIGTSKIGVLGAGVVPGGTETFNASGTFSVPPGVSRVNITGRGATGNPGNAGNAGTAGNPGTGGGAGGGGNFYQVQQTNTTLGGNGGFGLKQIFPNGLFGVPSNTCSYSFLQNETTCNWPSRIPTAVLQQSAYGSGNAPFSCPGNGSYNARNVNAQPGRSGNAGTAGNPGNPGNAGNASSTLCKTFPGGAGGNAGAGGAAGNGGSAGNAGGNGGHWDQRNPGSAGNSAGAGGAGLAGNFPCRNPANATVGYGGGGGGGAGINTAGSSGRSSTACPPSVPFQCRLAYAKGGDACVSAPLGPPAYAPIFNCYTWPRPPASSPTNTVGGYGGCGQAGQGVSAIAMNSSQLSWFNVNMLGGARSDLSAFTPQPLAPQVFRAGAGGGGGATGFSIATPSVTLLNTGAGGGGGGRGLVGNAGGATPTPSGSAATPVTFNCVAVTPGGSVPVTVASPGGQIVISWNPQ